MQFKFSICLVLCIPIVFCQNPPAAAVTGYMAISLDNFQSPRSWNSYFNSANLAPGVIIQAVPLIATSNSSWTTWDNPALSWAQGANFGNNIFFNWHINDFMVNITNPMHFLTLDIHVEMTTLVGQLKYDFGLARALTLTDADFPDLRNRQRLPAQFAGGETLTLYLSYTCSQPYYYGISCAIYCQPQTNTSADACFNCNPTNGTKICCNNTIFDPSNGCQRIASCNLQMVTFDVIFVLDASDYIGQANFNAAKKAIIDFASHYTWTNTRFALISCGITSTHYNTFSSVSDFNAFKILVLSVPFTPGFPFANYQKGIQAADQLLTTANGYRPDAHHMVVFIVGSQIFSDVVAPAAGAAQSLRYSKGVLMAGITISPTGSTSADLARITGGASCSSSAADATQLNASFDWVAAKTCSSFLVWAVDQLVLYFVFIAIIMLFFAGWNSFLCSISYFLTAFDLFR